jgi:pimeloyl-ACP methyl ester carboxylesterase
MSVAEKIPIVVLPGLDGIGELRAELAARLARRRNVQVITYPTDEPLGYDALTALVMGRVPSGRFAILGESFSGPIAIEIAATERSRVAGLILASSFARHPLPRWFAPVARMLNPRCIPDAVTDAAVFGRTGGPEHRAALHRALATVRPDVLRTRGAAVLQVDRRDRLRAVTCPILCLRGRLDRLVRLKCLNEIRSIQPGCQVRWFDAAHMVLETHPDEAAAAIDEFCDQLP